MVAGVGCVDTLTCSETTAANVAPLMCDAYSSMILGRGVTEVRTPYVHDVESLVAVIRPDRFGNMNEFGYEADLNFLGRGFNSRRLHLVVFVLVIGNLSFIPSNRAIQLGGGATASTGLNREVELKRKPTFRVSRMRRQTLQRARAYGINSLRAKSGKTKTPNPL